MIRKSIQFQKVAWMVLVVGLTATGSLWYISEKHTTRAIERTFNSRAMSVMDAIKDTLRSNERNLWLVESYLNAADDFNQTKWQTFVSDIHVKENWRGIQEIGLSVPIAPEGNQRSHTKIILQKTFGPHEKYAPEYDLWSNSGFREAMSDSRDTGLAFTSDLQYFLQETEGRSERGFQTYVPLYKTSMPQYSVEDKRLAFRGWIYSQVYINDLIESIQFAENATVEFEIYDGQNHEQKSLLYDSNEVLFGTGSQSGFLTKTEVIGIQDFEWTILFAFDYREELGVGLFLPKTIGVIGSLFSLFVFLTILSLTSRNRSEHAVVLEKTKLLECEKKITDDINEELSFQKRALDEHAIVSITDVNGIMIYVNDNLCKVSGYSREELLGKDHRMLNSDEHSDEFHKNLRQTITSGNVWRNEVKSKKKDGSFFWVFSSVVPHMNKQGEVENFICICTDISENKKTEKSIRQFRAALDMSADEVSIFSVDTLQFVYVNNAVAKRTGVSSASMVGRTISSANPLFDEEHFREKAKPLIAGATNFVTYEASILTDKGDILIREILLQLVEPDKTEELCFVVVARDITGRLEAEKETRQFKETLDLTQDEVYMFWLDTLKFFYVNQAAADKAGKTIGDFIDRTPAFINPTFKETEFRAKSKCLVFGTKKSISYETVHLNAVGELVPVDVLLQIIESEVGEPRFVAIARNITDRKNAENAIRQFKTTLDLTQDEVYMFWPDTLKIFYVNHAAKAQLGWSDDEFSNMTPVDVKPEFSESKFRKMLTDLMQGKQKSTSFETIHERRNGERFPVEIYLQYIAPSDEDARFVAIVKDITVRHEVDVEKAEFISTVTHELRTPLTSIKGALGIIRAGVLDDTPDKLHSMVNVAYDNSNRLEGLINDILDMEKIAAGEFIFQMGPTNINWLVEEAIEANAVYGDKYGVTFICSHIDVSLSVNVDRDRMMQVMANLLSNAAKFSSSGGTVEISVARRNGNVRVAVKDNGSGIPEDARATIFERFTQADSSDQRAKGGTGLGLNIAKAIVEKHGGTIGFSTETGKGTTFYFDLEEAEAES